MPDHQPATHPFHPASQSPRHPIHPSIHPSIYLSTYLSHLFVCLSIHPHISVHLPNKGMVSKCSSSWKYLLEWIFSNFQTVSPGLGFAALGLFVWHFFSCSMSISLLTFSSASIWRILTCFRSSLCTFSVCHCPCCFFFFSFSVSYRNPVCKYRDALG